MRSRGHALLVAVAAAEFATAAVFVVLGDFFSAASFAVVGFLIVLALRMERLAWVAGYLRGRSTMLASLGEAYERGLTVADWITAEAERDEFVISTVRPRRRRPGRRRIPKRREQ